MTNQTIKILVTEPESAFAARPLLSADISPEVESLSTALEAVATQRAEFVLIDSKAAQAILRREAETEAQASAKLDWRVQQRTAELAQAIEALREEVLETQQVEREIRRENQELAILNSIPATVSTALDLSEVLLVLKQQLITQLGVPGGCIFTYEPQKDEFGLAENWGLPDELIPIIRCFPSQAFPANEVIKSRRPVLFAQVTAEPLYRQLKLDQLRPEWQSCLCVPLLADGAIQGAIALFSGSVFNEAQVAFFTSFGRQVGVAFHHARLFEQVFAARERTQVLSQRLVEIQEAERRNIARELHDEIGQILTGLKLILEMSLRLPPEESRANVQEAQTLVGELMSKVRQISLDLRPGMLDDLGLLPALLWYFGRYTAQTKVQINFTHNGLDDHRFAARVETAAYRIVQEALTNVARYAGVAEVRVNAWADADILCVEIKDTGVGFDPDAALTANISSGLPGMGERARLLGGGLTIESEIGGGTSITAHLPIWGEMD